MKDPFVECRRYIDVKLNPYLASGAAAIYQLPLDEIICSGAAQLQVSKVPTTPPANCAAVTKDTVLSINGTIVVVSVRGLYDIRTGRFYINIPHLTTCDIEIVGEPNLGLVVGDRSKL